MDVKIQALDRVLEALSPVLGSELDRVVRETREAVEQEFKARLDEMVQEANAATSLAQAQAERAVEEAKEETRRQVTTELEQQFSEKLEARTNELKNESAEDRAKLQHQLEQWRIFAETERQLAEAVSQPELLARFLHLAESFAEGVAVYITRPDGLVLWKSTGKGAFPDIVSKDTSDPEFYFRTISVRGKTVGGVCAVPSYKADALDFLAGSLERAIEVFGLKLGAPLRAPISRAAVS